MVHLRVNRAFPGPPPSESASVGSKRTCRTPTRQVQNGGHSGDSDKDGCKDGDGDGDAPDDRGADPGRVES